MNVPADRGWPSYGRASREPLTFRHRLRTISRRSLAGLLLVKAVLTFITLIVSTALSARWGQRVDPVHSIAFLAGAAAASALLWRYLRSIDEGTRPQEAS
jgi:hypothetical protein